MRDWEWVVPYRDRDAQQGGSREDKHGERTKFRERAVPRSESDLCRNGTATDDTFRERRVSKHLALRVPEERGSLPRLMWGAVR